MRLRFSDGRLLLAQAKRNATDGSYGLAKWWSSKYDLPSTHKDYNSRSEAYWLREMFTDLWREKSELEEELENGSENSGALLTRLSAINKILLGEEQSNDELIDEWERDLEMGRIPDLTKGM